MYRGFVGTFISHFFSLLCTLWAIFQVHGCELEPALLKYARFGLLLVAANSSLALVRYGSSDGYKLRTLHIITLNVSAITNLSITEALVLQITNAPLALLSFPALNIIPLLSNIATKDYRTKLKFSDAFIAINCFILLLYSFFYENYYGVALSLSYFFGYFIIAVDNTVIFILCLVQKSQCFDTGIQQIKPLETCIPNSGCCTLKGLKHSNLHLSYTNLVNLVIPKKVKGRPRKEEVEEVPNKKKVTRADKLGLQNGHDMKSLGNLTLQFLGVKFSFKFYLNLIQSDL